MIRVPGCCVGRNDTTVLCHVRMIEIPSKNAPGMDFLGAWGCFACHAVVDGQAASDLTFAQRRLLLLEGVMRTQADLLKRGVVRIGWGDVGVQ
jgi:hypothetical protein